MRSQELDSIESFETFNEALNKSQVFQNATTGEMFNAETAEQRMRKFKLNAEAANKVVKKFGKSATTYFKWRNNLLFIGFILLLTSKVLSAYSVH